MVSLDANNFMDNGFTHLSFFITYSLRKYCRIYFGKIYCLIWRKFLAQYILRKYIVWFEENVLPNIFWENIPFDLKKIYCRIYFEKIYCSIWRKFLVQYILRKYTVWFEENLLSNIFWENILFNLKKIKKEWWGKHKS